MKTRLIAAIAATVLLAGCAPAADPAPSPSPTATATATSTPTPTPTPTLDLSDPANWVIGFDSVGPFEFGQPIADARAAAAGASYVEGEGVPDCRVAFLSREGSPSLTLPYWPDDVVTAIWVRNLGDSNVLAQDLAAASPKTEQGIGIGSTRDDVVAAYPDYTVLGEEADFFTVYSVAGPSGYLVFTMEYGVVEAIASTTLNNFSFEFC
ncbi:hypothetical protein [Schumannella luteola]